MGPLINDKVDRLDDGSPLRPFSEVSADEQPGSRNRSVTKIFAAIAVLGGVIKQFMSAEANDSLVDKTDTASDESHLTLIASHDSVLLAGTIDVPVHALVGDAPINDSGVVKLLGTPLARTPFLFDFNARTHDIQLRPTPALALNDNEALYAFKPGLGITLSPSGFESSGLIGSAPGGGASRRTPETSTKPSDSNGDDAAGSVGNAGENGIPSQGSSDKENPVDRTNQRPDVSGPVRLQPQYVNMSVLISASALLHGAADADGDPLHVASVSASSGTLAPFGVEAWLFTPNRGATDTVTFSYEVSDQALSISQTATLQLIEMLPVHIVGTDGGDTLVGTPGVDTIDAQDGDDVVLGREGDDVIYGRGGNDRLLGGDGDDIIFGHAGHDQIFAGAGNDVVFAGAGDDLIQGDSGDDVLWGEEGNDTFNASENDGNDVVDGGEGIDTYSAVGTAAPVYINLAAMKSFGPATGNDTLINIENVTGSASDDHIVGDVNVNMIDGSSGSDTIEGGGGNDILYGGDGADIFVATIDDGDDAVDGGNGEDCYDASNSVADVIIDLGSGTASGDDIGNDTLQSVERAIGGAGDDTLIAGDTVNVLTGGDGNDVFVFESSTAGYGSGNRDKILDFEVGDSIKIKHLNEEAAEVLEDLGFETFVLISHDAEITEPGQLRLRYESLETRDVTIIEGNIDNEFENHEFEIELHGRYELTEHDFYRG